MRQLWAGSVAALMVVCLATSSCKKAYAAEPVQESAQIQMEMMLFKVECTAKNLVGLTWGKNGEMREKDAATIVEWLKKQGEVTLLCSRSFCTDNNRETGIDCSISTTVAVLQQKGGATNFERRDLGTTLRVTPVTHGNEITIRVNLVNAFQTEQGGTGRYTLATTLQAVNGKTIVTDEIWTNATAEQAPQTALVLLITPRIVK